MAENSSSTSPQKAVPPPSTPNSNSNSQNPNPNPNPNPSLTSPQIPPSPSISDMSQMSSPQISQSQSQITSSQTLDYPLKQQILPQQQQQNLLSTSSSSFQMQPGIQRTGSMPRLSQIQHYGAAMAAGVMRQHTGMYGAQMSFGGTGQMQQQQHSQQQLVAAAAGIARAGMNGQSGQLQTTAAHFGLQSQMMSQARAKGIGQGTQFNPSNSAQALQAVGVLGQLSYNPQLRANGPLSYAQQQRFAHGQMRPQQISSQAALTSPQKLTGQSLPRTPSLAAMNQQLSSLPQNGQSPLVQTTYSQQQQQQWLKQMQPSMTAPGSPSYLQQQQQQQQTRQQQQALSQLSSAQLQQRSMGVGLTQQQISQLIQQHPQLSNQQQQQHLIQQQHLQQLQMLQQHQQQLQSPRLPGPAQQKSLSLTGSQPETPASGTTMTGGSSSQGAEATNQLLGKRKIQDLVAQVDPLGKLDPEVEDLLLEIADDFIDSVTTFACSLAKHRKSSTLEAKDLLLHLEKDWHLNVPGFSREEQNCQKNPPHLDVHKKRMEMIRTLMESQQSENSNGVKGVMKQIANDSAGDRPIKSSSSSEHLSMPAVGPQMVHKVHRF